jgi:hypothetical protein
MLTGPGCIRNGPTPSSICSAVYPGQCGPHRGRVVLQRDDTTHKHAKMPSLDRGMKVSESDVRVLEHQHQWSIDSSQMEKLRLQWFQQQPRNYFVCVW